MNFEIWIALVVFAFVSSVTPGPNNLMLMSSGANYGFRRSLPHMMGVSLGFSFMVILVGLGIVGLFNQFPVAYSILKVASALYLLYLSYKIATASSVSVETEKSTNPLSFLQAALFQWVNPKAWVMALTSISVYAPTQSIQAVVAVALVFGLVNLPSVSFWVVMGQQVKRWLTNSSRMRTFNVTMALLLVGSLYPVLV